MRAFRVAYDGRPFHGFQRQPSVPTVEDAIFDALRDLDVFEGEKPAGYSAAGRTDAGVSALSQTIAFEAPDWVTPRALNGELPETVQAWAAADVSGDFNAQYDANWREYTYFLYAPDIDDSRTHQAFDAVCGEHDFHNLTLDDEHTIRDVSGSVTRDGPYLVIRVRSSGFSRELVRRIVTLVRAVGSGADSMDKIDQVFGPEPIDGPEGIPSAPAYPLVLTTVEYDVAFETDEEAAIDAREIFGARAKKQETLSRVARTIADGIAPG